MQSESVGNLSQCVRVGFPDMWNDRQTQEAFPLLSIQLLTAALQIEG